MSQAGGVVVVGSLNADLTVQLERRPEPGETVLGGDLAERPGGKGANQAVAAARVGAHVSMVGRVGQDARAELLLDALRSAGVDVGAVAGTPDAATGAALITVTPDGENAIVVAAGANARLTPEDVERHAELIGRAAVVVCQLEIPLEVVSAAAAVTRGRFVLNAAPAQRLPGELLERVDVLAVNAQELEVVAGAAAVPDRAETVATLAGEGPDVVVATLGAEGALLGQDGSATGIPAPDAAVVDTTGAGDASVGALAAALAAGLDPGEAARVAVAAGTAAVAAPGAQPELPGLDDLRG